MTAWRSHLVFFKAQRSPNEAKSSPESANKASPNGSHESFRKAFRGFQGSHLVVHVVTLRQDAQAISRPTQGEPFSSPPSPRLAQGLASSNLFPRCLPVLTYFMGVKCDTTHTSRQASARSRNLSFFMSRQKSCLFCVFRGWAR